MGELKEIILQICIAALLVGVLQYLLPKEVFGKAVGWVVSLYLVVMIISPIGDGRSFAQRFSLPQISSPSYEIAKETAATMEKAAVEEVQKTVDRLAATYNLPVTVQSVKTQLRDGRVYITEMVLAVQGEAHVTEAFVTRLRGVIDTQIEVVEATP